jgi:hypothetical protein
MANKKGKARIAKSGKVAKAARGSKVLADLPLSRKKETAVVGGAIALDAYSSNDLFLA